MNAEQVLASVIAAALGRADHPFFDKTFWQLRCVAICGVVHHYCVMGMCCNGQALVDEEGGTCDLCREDDERLWNAIRWTS